MTFDDGPDPGWTPVLLGLLDSLDAHATFFPIARRAAEHPRLIERMLADGHAIGLHCDEHIRHSERDADDVRTDTKRALATLRGLGAAPSLWRTPWGELAPFTQSVADEHALRLVRWTHDTHDWRGDPAPAMFERAKPALHDGAIVLAHDGIGPGATREDTRETVELTRLIGAHARERGIELRTLA